MIIRSHLPWPARLLVILLVITLGVGFGIWAFDLGRRIGGVPESVQFQLLKTPPPEVQVKEPEKVTSSTGGADSELMILKSTQSQLAAQVKSLEKENTRLKEDLAFFETLLPNRSGPRGVAIQRLQAELLGPNQLRYQLLVMQNGLSDRTFVGNLQINATILQSGKGIVRTFPDKGVEDSGKFRLEFKYYQRIEGILNLPDGVSVKTVQVKVLEKGQVKALQSVGL